MATPSGFHGRERLIGELVTMVGKNRFVTVVGPSGAGRSSLLRAGLLPRLATSDTRVALFTRRTAARGMRCPAHPFLDRAACSLAAELTAARGLHLLTRQAVAGERANAEIVLVVDQFDEVFTQCRDTEQRSRFITGLVKASRASGGRCRIVLGYAPTSVRTACRTPSSRQR